MLKEKPAYEELEKRVNQLSAQLNQKTQEVAVLTAVQDGLSKKMETQGIYDLVGDKMVNLFEQATSIVIATFDYETNAEVFRYTIEKGERVHPESRSLDKLRTYLIQTREKVLIKNPAEGYEWFHNKTIEGTRIMQSGVFLPFIVDGKVVGYMSLQNVDQENMFSDSDAEILETLANTMSVALDNVRLFEETNRLLKETEQGKAELAVINSVQEGLVREIDIQGIYNLVGDRIRELFNAQVVIIASFDHKNQMEIFNYLVEKGQVSIPKPRPFDKIRKHLIETGQNILINENTIKAAAEFGMKVLPGTEMPKSLMFMPMKIGDKVTGYVSLQNIDQEHAFSFSDVRLLSTLANSMSVALQNAKLFDETNRLLKETEQQKSELAVINSVQEGLAKELDIDAIYELVGEKIREIFRAQVIDIATYDSASNLLEDRYAYEKGDRTLIGSWEPYGFRKHVIETGEVLLINENVAEVSVQYNNDNKVLHGQQPKSALWVPMISGKDVKGMISLQDLDNEQAFSASDVRLLKTLANSMTVALENARLFDKTTRLLKETEQRNAELAVINSVQESLVARLEIDSIYELVGEKMREIFNAQVIDIVTYDEKNNLIEDKYSFEKGDNTKLGPREPYGFRKHVIKTGQVLMHNSGVAKAAAAFGNDLLIGEMPKSQIYVPMMTAGKVSGIISLQNLDFENAFSDADLNLLTTLANSMSVALESARLFDETTRLLKETEQRNAELAVINSVQESLVAQMDMGSIYELVGEKMREIFNPQVLDIVTYDARNNLIEDKYAYEKGDRTKLGPREPKGFRKHVIRTGQLLLHNSNVEKAMKAFGNEILIGEVPKSQVYVPLMTGGKVSGIISLQNLDHEDAFSEADVSLLTTLANSMSVALESARLFDETNRLLKETEQRTAELAVINSVQDGLARELDIKSIYELVGERLRKIFPSSQTIVIRTFDHEHGLENFQYLIEKGQRFEMEPLEIFWASRHVIETKSTYYINENFTEISRQNGETDAIVGEAPKSAIFVPMVVGDVVKGTVSLQNMDHENAFSDSDIRLITTVTNSMSVALENARLFDETNRLLKETEQRTAELAVINSVQEGLSKELEINSIYELVGDRMCEVFPEIQTLVIRTFDHENGVEYFRYAIEKGERCEVAPRPILWANKQLIANRKTLYINENFVETSKKFGGTGVTTGKPPKSAVFVPMIVGDIVKGSISVQNVDKENAFTESDIRLLNTITNSMSVALENARLFDETNRLLKETEQRNAELAVINSVQENLVAQINMAGIYDLVGEKMREIFQAQVIDIVTYDKNKNLIEDQYAFENGDRTRLGPRPAAGFRKHVIETKQLLLINKDVDEERKKYGNTVLVGDPAKSLVIVPMIAGGEVTGVITLQNLEKEEAFSESDVSLLTTLTNSMSVALESARLFDETNRLLKETEQRTSELAVINSVQEGLVREMDMKAIYELVGERLCKLFPDTQTLVIRTFDHETGTETWEYAIEKGIRQEVPPRSLNWNSQLLIKTKKVLDIRRDYLNVSKKHGGTGVTAGLPPKSAVFVPMIVGDVVKGSVSLQNVDHENAFSDSDVRLLTTLTNSMSVALENARLFDETNRLLKETEQRTEELAVINSVQEGLAHELDLQSIYNLVGDRVQQLFQTHAVIIASLDPTSQVEHFHYVVENGVHYDLQPRSFNRLRQVLAEKKQTIYIDTEQKAREEYGITAIGETRMPKSLMFVPLMSSNNIKGYISIQNVDKEQAFNNADMRLLETLGNSMSVALENARLFNETSRLLAEAKQRATELSTVNTISKALASQLDADELIHFVGEQMRELFNANIVYLALLNKKTGIISFPYQYGDTMEPMQLGSGLTSKLILSGEPLLVNKDVQDLRQQMGIELVGIPAASYLGVPIPVGDEIIGVLSVQSTEQENRFNESDMRLLSTIAASVGVALNNANLFEEVKMAKMEAEAASKAAEKANEAKSAFLSTVSHELRTPLTSVLGFAKIIKKRLEEKIFPSIDQSDPKTQKTVNQISDNLTVVVSEGERLTHLINDVLDLAKIEAGKMEWNVEEVSMTEVAERAISATTALFDQKNIQLEKNIEKNLPPINGDRDKLIQVMINLISNAVKFTDAGSVACKVYKRKKELIVSISDTGIGIAPQDHAAVFEQFKQVGGDTLTDKPKGTGLGLPICKEIVEHHGGRIWLESEVGKGSTFSFSLPLTKTETAGKPMDIEKLLKQLKEQMAQKSNDMVGKKASILIVDDDDSIRSLLQQELSEAGYTIEEATNGKEALNMIREQKPDLVILDVMMPEMNGFDLAAILKNDPETMDIPIIILSIVQDKIRGFRIGVDRYLNKPIDTAQLFTEVGALLEQGKSKKKVMVVDEDTTALRTLTDVLETKGYHVVESNGKELFEKAVQNQPDIIILNSIQTDKHEVMQTLRFEKGLENVLFLLYQ